jgi:hypothetical protein
VELEDDELVELEVLDELEEVELLVLDEVELLVELDVDELELLELELELLVELDVDELELLLVELEVDELELEELLEPGFTRVMLSMLKMPEPVLPRMYKLVVPVKAVGVTVKFWKVL